MHGGEAGDVDAHKFSQDKNPYSRIRALTLRLREGREGKGREGKEAEGRDEKGREEARGGRGGTKEGEEGGRQGEGSETCA